MSHPTSTFTGTEKQVAFAAKIHAALIKGLVNTKMLAADKVAEFELMLDAKTSREASVWIDAAYKLAAGRDIISDNGNLGVDPRKFLAAITPR